MLNLKRISSLAVLFFVVPFITYAADIRDLKSLIQYIIATLNAIIPLLFAIAFIFFIWGVIKYMTAGGPQKMAEARNYLIFGIIALTVMISAWGLAIMVKNTFFESAQPPTTLQPNQFTSQAPRGTIANPSDPRTTTSRPTDTRSTGDSFWDRIFR